MWCFRMVHLFLLIVFTAGTFEVSALTSPGFEAPYAKVESDAHTQSDKAVITGEAADGWHDNSAWADVTVHYSEETEFVHGGESAQRIEIISNHGGRVQFVQPVTLEANKVYQGSFWLRASTFTAADLRLQCRKAPFKSVAVERIALSPEWREYTIRGVVEEVTDVFLMFGIEGTGDNTVTVWVDDARWENMSLASTDAPTHEGNLLNNGSFETALSGGWGVWVREFNRLQEAIRTEFQDDRPTMDTETSVDGRQSLRIDIPDARGAVIASPWVPFNFNRPHAASIALRASKPTNAILYIDGVPESNKSVMIDDQWRRYSTSAVLPYDESTRMVVRVWPNEAVTVWADGAQLEEQLEASADYIHAYPVELGLNVQRPGGIVFDGEPAPVSITTGGAVLPAGAHLSWQVRDLLEGTKRLPDIDLTASQESASPVEYLIQPDAERPRGMFKVRGQVLDGDERPLSAAVEVIFARLPQPRELDPADSFFGTHTHLTPELIEIARATGFRWLRLHDVGNLTKWRYVEENQGSFVFQDEGVDAARAAGLRLLGMLDGAPPWAGVKPVQLLGNHSVYNFPDLPSALDFWGRYVSETVTHYKGRIDHWEVWNEPWAKFFFRGTAEDYATLLMRASNEAKTANPDAKIVGVNSVGHSSMSDKRTPAVLKITGTDCFDIFSFHDYNSALYGGLVPQSQATVDKFEAILEMYGSRKPIWNTEGGPGTTMSWYCASDRDELLVRNQLAHIVRFNVTQVAAGIKRFFFYTLYHHQVIDPVGFIGVEHDRTIRPLVAASAVLASLVDGADCEGRVTPADGLEGYRFKQTDGMCVSVLWSEDGGEHSYDVPEGAKAWDVLGNTLPGETVEVGAEPVYIIHD
jgi:hypothetical protein